MKSWQWFLAGLLGFAFGGPLLAQSAHLHHGSDNAEFMEQPPRIGELVPDVTGLDEQRNEFSLRDLKGQHTVLICGCLT